MTFLQSSKNMRLLILGMIWTLLCLLFIAESLTLFHILILGGLASLFIFPFSENPSNDHSRRIGIVSVRAQALNNIPTPMIILAGDFQCTFANKAATQMIGEPIDGRDFREIFSQSDILEAIQSIFNKVPYDQTIRFSSDKDRSYDVSVFPIPAGGSFQRGKAIVYFYEVTRLLETEKMRVDFVANASHELRTPLSSISGFIETLQGPAKDDPKAAEKFLGIMQTEADRMSRLIEDLLSLSHIELDRHSKPSDPLRMEALIKSAVHSLKDRAEKRGISFHINVRPDLSLCAGDSDQLMQVLVNLLANASKYALEDSDVIVGARPYGDDEVEVYVQDEGPGISEEHLSRLTERFYRVDTARSRKMGGTGLGLAIVKHILLRHESELKVKSKVGKGTRFSFVIPVYNEEDHNDN